MAYTAWQSRYFAEWLLLQGSDESRLARTLAGSRIDMQAHQIDAALFALKAPPQQGVLLADEVGLGKTIEAGLVIAQRWAERRRRILLIVPAMLRKQWAQELAEKFELDARVLDAKAWKTLREGEIAPFAQDAINIVSYEFAHTRQADIAATDWQLVVLDEAHKLRNIWRDDRKRLLTIAESIKDRPKVLLTATPLQNSLRELYGLVSVVDPHLFGGGVDAFDAQYGAGSDPEQLEDLRRRLQPVCRRVLRRQVMAAGGIRFTNRYSMTVDFAPTPVEQTLYEGVTDFLRQPDLESIDPKVRPLMLLVIHKILASSTWAVAGTLGGMVERLRDQAGTGLDDLAEDYETAPELAEEEASDTATLAPPLLQVHAPLQKLRAEIDELERLQKLAVSIDANAKGEALLDGLHRAFAQAERIGAPRKAVIFTESRRTQDYLRKRLESAGFSGRLVLLNGDNKDAPSQRIYRAWLRQHAGTPRVSGVASADLRAALVDAFREPDKEILLSTEAGAEGVNLQFCALLINYDLPWNPQRVEQRIGRVHRYGQKHDVVVVNFVNTANPADERVLRLLERKFRLFDGVFGASDEILGALEGGIDIERRIADIYQHCRTAAEIGAAFDELEQRLEDDLRQRDADTRRRVLENFDDEVVHRLQDREGALTAALDRLQQHLLLLARAACPQAPFHDDGLTLADVRYSVDRERAERENLHWLRLDAEPVRGWLEAARTASLPLAALCFDADSADTRYCDLDPLRGQSGWLVLERLVIDCIEPIEHLLLAGLTDAGTVIGSESLDRLLRLAATVNGTPLPPLPAAGLDALLDAGVTARLGEAEQANLDFFERESDKLDRWAE
ncbi:MAG: DEAD/DEAH box helicase, partial [Proteobacteria bacterium]|nr:DEAD/DEAH box helicase [Pseudomonadota bacterium]